MKLGGLVNKMGFDKTEVSMTVMSGSFQVQVITQWNKVRIKFRVFQIIPLLLSSWRLRGFSVLFFKDWLTEKYAELRLIFLTLSKVSKNS